MEHWLLGAYTAVGIHASIAIDNTCYLIDCISIAFPRTTSVLTSAPDSFRSIIQLAIMLT